MTQIREKIFKKGTKNSNNPLTHLPITSCGTADPTANSAQDETKHRQLWNQLDYQYCNQSVLKTPQTCAPVWPLFFTRACWQPWLPW